MARSTSSSPVATSGTRNHAVPESSLAFSIYLYALVVQFGALSMIAAARLWRAGRNQPSVARNRMHMLSLAAAAAG